MSLDAVSLPSATRTNLNALAVQSKTLQQTQQRLSTGKAVNSASDNAAAFFQSQAFLQRANDLKSVKENLSTSLTTITATTSSISSVSDVVNQLKGITTQAAATTDPTARAGFAKQFNELLPQLNNIVKDANFNGTNLLNGGSNSLNVAFNPDNTSNLTVNSVDASANGLGIVQATNSFGSSTDIDAANAQLQSATSSLNTYAANFGGNATLIQTRQDFTSDQVNNLQTASDNQVQSDTNEEAANLLAQLAQNQLSVVSLNVSGQAQQSVLKLFGG